MIITGNLVCAYLCILPLCLAKLAFYTFDRTDPGSTECDYVSTNLKDMLENSKSPGPMYPRGKRNSPDERSEINSKAIESEMNVLDDAQWTLVKVPAQTRIVDHLSDGKFIGEKKDEYQKGMMWFGPRGKRSRSDHKSEINTETIESLINALDNAQWELVKVPAHEKRQQFITTPRLGRESDEDLVFYGRDVLENSNEDHSIPPLFAPRLGRRLAWVPRLGRQLRNVMRKI